MSHTTTSSITTAHRTPVEPADLALRTLTPLRRFQVVSAHLDAFFGAFLQDRTSPLLETSTAYPEVVIARRH
jgi:hypothetical protein